MEEFEEVCGGRCYHPSDVDSGLPQEENELVELKENLARMGCEKLLEVPWSFRNEAMVQEVVKGTPNEFDNSFKCDPSCWTTEKWPEVYQFWAGGSGYTFRKDDFGRGKFADTIDPNNKYPILDCTVERERKVVEFVVPSFYLEKPTRVTLTLRNKIFGSLSGERPID